MGAIPIKLGDLKPPMSVQWSVRFKYDHQPSNIRSLKSEFCTIKTDNETFFIFWCMWKRYWQFVSASTHPSWEDICPCKAWSVCNAANCGTVNGIGYGGVYMQKGCKFLI